MSVLHIRSGESVDTEQVVEITKPLPLRKIDVTDPGPGAQSVEIEDDDALVLDVVVGRPARIGRLRRWLVRAACAGALATYPAMIVAGSDVGGGIFTGDIDQSEWIAPWAAGAAALLEHHYQDLGWANDAASWTPASLLTAKPAMQAAMAQSVAEYIAIFATQDEAGRQVSDLRAAIRLVGPGSTGPQLRAAAHALRNYDRLLKGQGATSGMTSEQAGQGLAVIESWASRAKDELGQAGLAAAGTPIDRAAIVSVYAARGRAQAAYTFLLSMNPSEAPSASEARGVALDAWRAVAEFEPLVVLNASPDATLLGNHPSAMGLLVSEAERATRAYKTSLGQRADA